MIQKIDVYIIEDQKLLIDAYSLFFIEDLTINILGDSGCGEEAIQQIKAHIPDVVLLDIRLPKSTLDGIDLIDQIKVISETIKILVISQYDELLMIENLMQRGIHGFRAKNSSLNDIKTAILNVHNGRYDFPIGPTKQTLITDRERTILKLLTKGKAIVQIADVIGVSAYVINRNLKSLREKFNAEATPQLIGIATKSGII